MVAKSLDTIYQEITKGKGEEYILLFHLQDLCMEVLKFDPASNEMLPTTVDDVLHSMGQPIKKKWWNDRFQHIVNFAEPAIRHILENLRHKNIREYRVTRPEKIRKTDSTCMQWLSMQPGYNIKQKIGARQRMKGLFHDTSIDTLENRLFKAFIVKIELYFSQKEACCKYLGIEIPQEIERLIRIVRKWLRAPETNQISPWTTHLPPNNTLLNDKYYRKIWIAWKSLQNLDCQNQQDIRNITTIKVEILLWLVAGRLNRSQCIHFLQSSLTPDFENLSFSEDTICPRQGFVNTGKWVPLELYSCAISSYLISVAERIKSIDELFFTAENTVEHIRTCFFPTLNFTSKPISAIKGELAALDLCSILPAYTIENNTGERISGKFSQKLLFQEQDKHSYSCRYSKFISVRERKTYSLHSIFQMGGNESLEKVSLDLCKTIKEQLPCKKCIYIVQDNLDDFSPAVVTFKRNMNFSFDQTKILPRSIAAVFSRLQKIHDWHQKTSSTNIIVDDKLNNLVIELKILTTEENDKIRELESKNPETKGLHFRRLSVKETKLKDCAIIPESVKDILKPQDYSLLQECFSIQENNGICHFDKAMEKNHEHDVYDSEKYTIILSTEEELSKGALEYHHLQNITPDIPLWSICLPKLAMIDSTKKEFILVEPEKSFVQPTGTPETILVEKEFELSSKKMFYEFPLIQGDENTQTDKYYAYIQDSVLPLKSKVTCTLTLTYTYGKPLPYQLDFKPKNQDANFRTLRVRWESNSHKDGVHNMPYPEFVKEYTWEDMKKIPKRDKQGEYHNFTGKWLPELYTEFQKQCTEFQTMPSKQNKTTKRRSKWSKKLRFPALMAWNNGRSISDGTCPEDFKAKTIEICEFIKKCKIYDIDSSEKLIERKDAQEWCFFLACMHKDTLKEFSDLLCGTYFENIGNSEYEETTAKQYFHIPKWIAFALGDCTEDWQKNLLKKTVDILDGEKSEYGIKILAIALWRVNNFVYKLEKQDIERLLKACLTGIKQYEDGYLICACLECIIGLCRFRNPEQRTSDSILELLSPQKNRELIDHLSGLETELKKNKIEIQTFLILDYSTENNAYPILDTAYKYLKGLIDTDEIKVVDTNFS